jgi:hypothetical protein
MRDNGEATVVLSVAGALAAGAPIAVALSSREVGDGLIYIGALVLALTAIGVGVGKVWRGVFQPLREVLLGRPPEHDDPGQPALSVFIQDTLKARENHEAWKFGLQEQVRDLADRLDQVHPDPRKVRHE